MKNPTYLHLIDIPTSFKHEYSIYIIYENSTLGSLLDPLNSFIVQF